MAKYIDIDKAQLEFYKAHEGDEFTPNIITLQTFLLYYPPADVRPVVRGRWIPHPDPKCKEWDVCAACETGCKRREYGTNPDGTGYVTEWSYPYCPNCGADMRGESEGGKG